MVLIIKKAKDNHKDFVNRCAVKHVPIKGLFNIMSATLKGF